MEAKIERRLVSGCKALGVMCIKLTSPSLAGLPDRLLILPGGRVEFVELKSPTGRLSKLQSVILGRLKKLGAPVQVLTSQEEVDAYVAQLSGRCS